MANLDTPFGLRPVKKNDGSPWCGEANMYVVLSADTSDYFIGDLVMPGGSADVNGIPSVIKYVAAGTGATAPLGAIVGVHPVRPVPGSLEGKPLALENKFIKGTETVDRYVMVADDPNLIFEVQADSTGVARNSVGSNVDVTVTAPANDNQLSATVLNNATDAATATLPFRIVGFVQRENNEINATAATNEPFIVALVRPNEHAYKAGTVGLAV